MGGFSAQGLPLDVKFPETMTTPMVYAFVSSSSEPSMGLIVDRVKRLMSKFKLKGQEKSVLNKEGKGFISSRWSKGTKMRKIIADLGTKVYLVWLKRADSGQLRGGEGRTIEEEGVRRVEARCREP